MPNQIAVSAVDQAGDIGGNGISRFYWIIGSANTDILPSHVDEVHNAIRAFYAELASLLPPSMSYTIQPDVNVIDLQSGQLVTVVAGGVAQPAVHGLAPTGPYPAGVGARINWVTTTVLNGRRVRGAVFIAPLSSQAYEADGAILGTAQQLLVSSAGTLVLAIEGLGGNLSVYHRPPKGEITGMICPIHAWKVGTTPASLRSRRV